MRVMFVNNPQLIDRVEFLPYFPPGLHASFRLYPPRPEVPPATFSLLEALSLSEVDPGRPESKATAVRFIIAPA